MKPVPISKCSCRR